MNAVMQNSIFEVTSLMTNAPEQATQNVSGSTKLMKALTSTALSAVMYYRRILPEDAFVVHHVRGHSIPYIRISPSCNNSNLFHTLLESIRKMLDKGYLSEVMINVYKNADNLNTPLESYVYKYNYVTNKETETQKNNGKRNDSVYIQQKIFCMMEQSKMAFTKMKELPKDYELAVYVKYTDDVPEDYVCQGFDPCDLLPDVNKKISIQLGRITTPYHQLKIYNHLDEPIEFMNMENDVIKPSQETAKDLFQSNTMFAEKEQINQTENEDNTRAQEKRKPVNLSLKKPTNDECEDDETSNFWCPCKRNFTSSIFITIQCQTCNKYQHAECFGLTDLCTKADFVHCCDTCAEKNCNIVCSDPELVHKNCEEKKIICLTRTTLHSFNYYREMDIPLLMSVQHISRPVAKYLFQHVSAMNVFEATNSKRKTSLRFVNSEMLNNIIPKYFNVQSNNAPTTKTTDQMENLQLNVDNEMMLTPNILTNISIDYSPSKTTEYPASISSALRNELMNSSPLSTSSRRSSRLTNARKRYFEEDTEEEIAEKPLKKKKGAKKLFKKSSLRPTRLE